MRIIAGKCKGRKLLSLRGDSTRPTSAKVREAIFDILANRVEGARVLDLFAGTGAFGLEAISRGAVHAVFIDSERAAAELIRRNVSACRAEDAATVICWNILRNLNCLLRSGGNFDLVFMDPPYNRNAVVPTLENLVRTGTLAAGAAVIIEHSPEEALPGTVSGLSVTDQRKYGGTMVTFMTSEG